MSGSAAASQFLRIPQLVGPGCLPFSRNQVRETEGCVCRRRPGRLLPGCPNDGDLRSNTNEQRVHDLNPQLVLLDVGLADHHPC